MATKPSKKCGERPIRFKSSLGIRPKQARALLFAAGMRGFDLSQVNMLSDRDVVRYAEGFFVRIASDTLMISGTHH